ncbi:probable tRNA (uracil-O(2)-)-methyltransferase [Cylas formicarius]|uniref:probable tRNA (uracil-O(2)-)-methyltransferase n=1 Tax=Cylas formicarius TaxID=197179 RepID=UPI0029584C08|nr:probable tRNA (uracil-O(2)-)-methyltransferase [Cylas formicarius]
MFRVPLATSSTIVSVDKFWAAVLLYHDRPHLVNRNLVACSQAVFCQIILSKSGILLNELFSKYAILYEVRKLKAISKDFINLAFVMALVKSYDKNAKLVLITIEDFKAACSGTFVSIRVLFPRPKSCQKSLEFVTFDKDVNRARFLSVNNHEKLHIAPPFAYEIQLGMDSHLVISLDSFEDADTVHAQWIADKLFTKLLKWIDNFNESKKTIHSLSLVNIDEYCSIYNTLKDKYGQNLIKLWPSRTTTNPQKYIFEDIAIASFLICIWKTDKHINFVDCGCGNGLLVYLLTQEGFSGYGLDVRRRPIWDIYPDNTKLLVNTVTPTSVFPECTWIIGNHSDELTPWIPVIALKSSPHTNFFVLPCCPYDFSGRKYIRTNGSISSYADYLNYIKNVCETCGFETNFDKLRIPSTKRTCLIGISKLKDQHNYNKLLQEVSNFVDSKIPNDVVQRSDTEKVRNCTQLGKSVISKLVASCIQILLSKADYIAKPNGGLWNKGSAVQISDLAKNLEKEDLKWLRKECGGLQTLLRNHRYLFEISKCAVRLRLPIRAEETNRYNDKPCWFFKNHSDGCLFDGTNCGYSHN